MYFNTMGAIDRLFRLIELFEFYEKLWYLCFSIPLICAPVVAQFVTMDLSFSEHPVPDARHRGSRHVSSLCHHRIVSTLPGYILTSMNMVYFFQGFLPINLLLAECGWRSKIYCADVSSISRLIFRGTNSFYYVLLKNNPYISINIICFTPDIPGYK